ncbi:MAG: M24 family metallopeptidase [Clostridia bacterium]|nr:M24 family metallopeptidase [Clostridia bacterium]
MLENVIKIQKLLKLYGLKVWIMVNGAKEDRYFTKYISKTFNSSSYTIISQKLCYILINDLDKDNIDVSELNSKNIKIYSYVDKKDFDEKLEYIISELKFVKEIALSYSTMSDPNMDILSHGMFVDFTKKIKKMYSKYNKKIKFKSAEKVMYALSSIKTEKQIQRHKFIGNITHNILEDAFCNLKIGISEIQIAEDVKQLTKKHMETYIGKEDILSYDFAWDNCPIVLTGSNLAKGGHTLPSEKIFCEGDTVYFDFGLIVKFSDGEKLATDIQRMGYALKKDEKNAPKQVQNIFKILLESIEDGMEEMRPGIKAYKIDNIVRGKILKSGYPNYNHATGHPVGELVHDIGAVISIKASKLSNLELVENGVYTLEPRVNVVNGGSIEEMILVTKYGGINLCTPQKKLYIIS